MDVLLRLDAARRAANVLEHPFYERWSAGELRTEELSLYAGEYRCAVLALAEASRRAAAKAGGAHEPELRRHAEEEAEHVELWDDFARAAGAGIERREPLAGTSVCVEAWTAGENVLEHLAVLYAIEASQPKISKTKMEGLTRHYGYTEESPALAYFKLHAILDIEHARQAGELIDDLISSEDVDGEAQADRMVARARGALEGNWELLDGVEGRFARAAA